MNAIGHGISRFYDAVFAPLAGHPAWAMVAVSVLTAVWALLVFKAVTPQRRLTVGRDRLIGHIYEMGLYQDHLSVLGRIQRNLAAANLRYLLLTLPALVVLTVPMLLTLAQLDSRYSHRRLAPGESTVFSIRVDDDVSVSPQALRLEAPPSVIVEAGPVRVPGEQAVAWRVSCDVVGEFPMRVMLYESLFAERMLPVGNDDLTRLNESSRRGWAAPLLAPGAPPVEAGSDLAESTLRLPERRTRYLGIEMHWLAAFLLFSLAGGLALKDVLRVSM